MTLLWAIIGCFLGVALIALVVIMLVTILG